MKKYSLNKTTVSKIVKTLDPNFYKNRKRVCPNIKKLKKEISFELKNKIIEMSKTYSQTQISKIMNVSRYIVNRTIKASLGDKGVDTSLNLQ